MAPQTHVVLAGGDENTRNHLQATRKLAAGIPVDLDICNADLTIKGGKDESLRVAVDFDSDPAESLAGNYVQRLDVSSPKTTVKLHLPKNPRARVMITLPAGVPTLQLNLVRGDLSFETDRIRGERNVNVVSGHVELLANPDAYSSLHASVLMGSFHDHRPGGGQSHGMVSKSQSGTGHGNIDLNVVKGSVDVRAWD